MDLLLKIDLKKPTRPINYRDKIFLVGSCFTEHIGDALDELKFAVLQNPHGILFDPFSVCKSLLGYIQNKQYTERDLFQLHEVWHSWDHHSRFSNTQAAKAVLDINASQSKAHDFLKQANWIVITLGSSFSYQLANKDSGIASFPKGFQPGTKIERGVANCHRAPAQWFHKYMLEIDETTHLLATCCKALLEFNPDLQIIFTISPVRHIRDGVVENNRSKARLIEAVNRVMAQFDQTHYFPAYELLIDVLRDYRFYDADLVHPNYMGTQFVLEKFTDNYIDIASQALMQDIKQVAIAGRHKPLQPDTRAHRDFLAAQYEKTKLLQEKYPFLDLSGLLEKFSQKEDTR